MRSSNEIHYLRNHEIDRTRWDACVDRSSYALIYAYSFYLDSVCDNWDALVINDYQAVMPLPWRKKFGIKYIYPPSFTQQLGIYSINDVSKLIPELISFIRSKFSFGEYYFNYCNTFISTTSHTNFTLRLKEYSEVRKNYKSHLIRNLKKAEKNNLNYSICDDYEKAIMLHHSIYGSKMPHIKLKEVVGFIRLCRYLQNSKSLLVREVTNKEGELQAITLCLMYNNRIYLWLPSTTNLGRQLNATHFLLDQLILEFSSKDYILDFVGSDIPGVYRFYEDFGAINQPYLLYRWNQLPWPFKLIKKFKSFLFNALIKHRINQNSTPIN